MKPSIRKIIMLIIVVSFLPVFATTYRSYDLDGLLARADIIVFAEVTEVTSALRAEVPWTTVSLEPLRILKGDETAAAAAIAFYGGNAEGRSLEVEGMPRFAVGEQVLILRYDNTSYASPLVGFSQGLWKLQAQGFVDNQQRILAVSAAGVLGFAHDFAPKPDDNSSENPLDAANPADVNAVDGSDANRSDTNSSDANDPEVNDVDAEANDSEANDSEANVAAPSSEADSNEASANPSSANASGVNEAAANPSNDNEVTGNQTATNETDANPSNAGVNPTATNETATNPSNANETATNPSNANETDTNPSNANETTTNQSDTNQSNTNETDANPSDDVEPSYQVESSVVLDAIAARLLELAEAASNQPAPQPASNQPEANPETPQENQENQPNQENN